jgi:hypothetical protein
MRLVNAMQHQIGQGNGIRDVVFLATVERAVLERVQRLGGRLDALPDHVLGGFGEKAARSATWVANGVAQARIHRAHHGANQFPWGVELPAIGVLLAHLQQQALVNLREHELMLRVGAGELQGMDAIEHVGEVRLGVHADRLDRRQNFADDALSGCRAGHVAKVAQMRQQLVVDEIEVGSAATLLQGAPLPSL